MNTTTNAAQSKFEKIMANAKQNRREAGRYSLTVISSDAEERLKVESISEGQMEMLDRLRVSYDSRPVADGGTTSRWNAMQIIEEALRYAHQRREKARAEPATGKQLTALLNFGCNAGDLEGLTSGDASDLIRRFAKEITAQKAARATRAK